MLDIWGAQPHGWGINHRGLTMRKRFREEVSLCLGTA
jgi:hypothetical protein